MREVVKKMLYKSPKCLLAYNILLATVVTVPAMQGRIAVKAYFLKAFRLVGHNKNFLKIKRIGSAPLHHLQHTGPAA